MAEAIVRTCAFTNGVGIVEIPDECLEQARAITAWLYRVDGAQGRTIKTITISITERTRPKKTRDVPITFEDKYGLLIQEINEAIGALEDGTVTVAKALTANTAGHATTAGSASSATYATSAGASKLTWRSINDLIGVEYFSQANTELDYTATLTSTQMAEYFPRGKVCLIRRYTYADEQTFVPDVQLTCPTEGMFLIKLDNPELSIIFDGNEIQVYCYDEQTIPPLAFKLDIATLG